MTKKHIIRISVLLLVVVGACSSLMHHRNEEALANVKKVAVIGFAIREPRAPGIDKDYKKEAEEMLTMLHQSFGKKTKWQVVPIANMKENAAYKETYNKTMKGWHNRFPVPESEKQLLVDGVMDNDSMRILGTDGRTALMKALGVDAIITAEVKVLINSTTIMGIGSRKPWSRLSFQLFRPNQNAPDWFEGGVDGDEAKTSIGATGFIDRDLMNRLAIESAKTAFSRIGEKQK